MRTSLYFHHIKTQLTIFLLATVMPCISASPKYIFYFIGDGMGIGHIIAAETYNRYILKNPNALNMMNFSVASTCTTYSANSPVTDSSAAGTALSSGFKTKNYMLGMSADSIPVMSIAEKLHDMGYGVGIVTTVCPDDATPGAFYAHVPNRKMFYEIGCQAAASDYEFIAGSRWRGKENTDLMDLMAKHGVKTVSKVTEVLDANSRRIALIDNDSIDHIGYSIDGLNENNLPAMTEACINHLIKYTPEKFFVMIEGGNIDWAAHGNDGGTVVKEIINFDNAIKKALDFYKQHPDETLIIVTADHDTGGLTLGNNFTGCTAYPHLIDNQKMSKDAFSEWCKNILKAKKKMSWEEMRDCLTSRFGFWNNFQISENDEKELISIFNRTFRLQNSIDQETLYNSFNEFAVKVFDLINTQIGFGWTSRTHTGNLVPVYAIGKDASRFKSQNDNIDIPKHILSAVLE